ncbi:MAG TPA: septum formation initiator family protein [Terriglobales bacterium]|nr:septum formation initiator family protein [Terriglobales bacterium]
MDFPVTRLRQHRILPTPEEGVRALVEHAPEAEAWVDNLLLKLRPTMNALYAVRRRIATGAIAVFSIWFFVHVMFGANGMVVYRQKKSEYQDLRKEIESLQQENGRFNQQIKSLESDPKAIEKEAREQLHYARPGEVIYVSPPTLPRPEAWDSNAARK